MSIRKQHVINQLRTHINALQAPTDNARVLERDFEGGLLENILTSGAIHEFVPGAYADFPAALGFMLCLLLNMRSTKATPVLWCSLGGRSEFPSTPYPQGLSYLGMSPENILQVSVQREKEMLWVLEEGLSSSACPLVVGVYTDPGKLYDFTASRRLSVRAAAHGSTLLLLRHHSAMHSAASGNSTAAVTRWRISSRPSASFRYSNAKTPAMGRPCWHVALTRSKQGALAGQQTNWQLEWDHETLSFCLVTPLVNRAVPSEKYNPQQIIAPRLLPAGYKHARFASR